MITIDVTHLGVPAPAVDLDEDALTYVRAIDVPVDLWRRMRELEHRSGQPTEAEHPKEHRLRHALRSDVSGLPVSEDRSHEPGPLAPAGSEIIERCHQLRQPERSTRESIVDRDLDATASVQRSKIDHGASDRRDA
jgi:hypothetical protein